MNGVKIYDKVDGLWIPHINLQLFAGNTYYVDFDTGLDTNSGTSMGSPWKHCPDDPNATDTSDGTTLLPGDTVILKGGVTYSGRMICAASGTSGNAITYDGNSAETWGTGKAIIIPPDAYFYNINGNDYITLKYLEMTGGSRDTSYNSSGVFSLSPNDNLIIRDCYIHNNNCRGISLKYATNALIKDNELSYHQEVTYSQAWGVGFEHGSDIIIEGNHIHHNGVGAVAQDIDTMDIRYNLFEDAWKDVAEHHEDHIFASDSYDIDTYCNKFSSDPLDQGIFYNTGQYNRGTTGSVWSNVIIGKAGNLIPTRWWGVAPATNVKVYNNSVYCWDNGRVCWVYEDSVMDVRNNAFYVNNSSFCYNIQLTLGTYTGDYNIFHDNLANPLFSHPNSSPDNFFRGLSAWQGFTGEDANSDDVDPLFTDPANEDLTLQSGSPCIGAGQDLSGIDAKYAEALVPGTTFPNPETTTRTGSWDIGAYKHSSDKLALALKS